MPSAEKPNDQNDPVSTGNSGALCSDSEQLGAESVVANPEMTSPSLIDNWIDA
jgi:hypothetical protein